MNYRAPEFYLQSLHHELEKLAKIASGFLDISATRVLRQNAAELRAFGESHSAQERPWRIRDEDHHVLRTRSTRGFEEGNSGGYDVFGELAFNWEVTLTDSTRNASFKKQCLKVTGNASTQIRIVRCDNHAIIAQWQFEIGASDSPGTFFHVGVGNAGGELFPNNLPVPRIPALLVTPTDALDFLLGELFQTEWPQANAAENDDTRLFGRLQHARLTHMLRWCLDGLTPRAGVGSAWMTLKRTKPRTDLPFLAPYLP